MQRTHKKRRRAAEVKQLADAARTQAEARPPAHNPVEIQVDLELGRIKETYSIPEVIEMVRQAEKKPKRAKGRPTIPHKFQILDAAAKVKAAGGHYSKLAPRFKLTTKQLTDLVQTNRVYFNRKVTEFGTTK